MLLDVNPSTNTSSTPEPKKPDETLAVRFASVDQEIEPAHVDSLDATLSSQVTPSNADGKDVETLIKAASALNLPRLQERRISNFAFEPVSLPASRVRCNSLIFSTPHGLDVAIIGKVNGGLMSLLSLFINTTIHGTVDEFCGFSWAYRAFVV